MPSHPGNDYYVNIVTHTIQRESNPLIGRSLILAGYIGPYNWANAQAAVAGAKLGAGTGAGNAIGTAQGAGQAANLGGLGAIGDFFNRLTQPNTWVRVGEVAAGVLLLYLGLNATMRGTAAGNAVQSATRTAKKVAEVVPK
jgi:hypothetical protein